MLASVPGLVAISNLLEVCKYFPGLRLLRGQGAQCEMGPYYIADPQLEEYARAQHA